MKSEFEKSKDHIDGGLSVFQKSNRVLFPVVNPLHQVLNKKIPWYRNWSNFKYSKFIHYSILLIIFGTLSFIFYQLLTANARSAFAATTIVRPVTTWSATQEWTVYNPSGDTNPVNAVNETVADDTTRIYTNTIDAAESFVVSTANVGTVYRVVAHIRARGNATSSPTIRVSVKGDINDHTIHADTGTYQDYVIPIDIGYLTAGSEFQPIYIVVRKTSDDGVSVSISQIYLELYSTDLMIKTDMPVNVTDQSGTLAGSISSINPLTADRAVERGFQAFSPIPGTGLSCDIAGGKYAETGSFGPGPFYYGPVGIGSREAYMVINTPYGLITINNGCFVLYLPPTVTTLTADPVTTTTAQANFSVGGGYNHQTHGVKWYPQADCQGTETDIHETNPYFNSGTFHSDITGLSPGTTYSYKGYATNIYGQFENYGACANFQTLGVAPTLKANPATALTSTGATLNGEITNIGGANATERGFKLFSGGSCGTSIDSPKDTGGSYGVGTYSKQPTISLSPATTYSYRAYATNTYGSADSPECQVFTTIVASPSAPTNAYVDTLAQSSLALRWTDNSNNESQFVIERSVDGATFSQVGTQVGDANSGDVHLYSAAGTTGLSANTRYWFRVKATNAGGESAYAVTAPKYTLIEPISGITWGAFTVSSLSAKSQNTPSNLSAGSSGIQYCAYKVSDNSLISCSAWQTNTNEWPTPATLLANTQYKITIQSRNGDTTTTSPYTGLKFTKADKPNAPTVMVNSWDANPAILNSITISLSPAANPAVTEFAIACDSAGTSWLNASNGSCGALVDDFDHWKTKSGWETIGQTNNVLKKLTCDTDISVTTRSRNGDKDNSANSDASSLQKTAPCKPLNLRHTDNTTSTISWTCDANKVAPTGYELLNDFHQALNSAPTCNLVQNKADGLGMPLDINHKYSTYIRAYRNLAYGEPSSIANAYTSANLPTSGGHDPRTSTTTGIKWTWDKNNNPTGTKFCIINDGNCVPDITSYFDDVSARKPNNNYSTLIYALNGDNEKTADLSISAYTAIEKPQGVNFISASPNSMDLQIIGSFTDLGVSDGSASHYAGLQIEGLTSLNQGEVGKESGFWNAITPNDWLSTQNILQDKNLNSNTEYIYCARARNAANEPTACIPSGPFKTTSGAKLLISLDWYQRGEISLGNSLVQIQDYTKKTDIMAGVPFDATVYETDLNLFFNRSASQDITLRDSIQSFAPQVMALLSGQRTYKDIIITKAGTHHLTGEGSSGVSDDFEVIPAACSVGTSTIEANPIELNADEWSTIRVQFKDQFGNVLAGHSFAASSNQTEDQIRLSGTQTDENGVAYVYVTSPLGHTSNIFVFDTTSPCQLNASPITFKKTVPPEESPTPTPTPTPTITRGYDIPTTPVLSVTGVSQTTVALAWTVSQDQDGIKGYKIYNADTNIEIGDTTQTSYQISGLEPDTLYRFYIRAYDNVDLYSALSNIVSVTTLAGPGEVIIHLDLSNTPTTIDAGQIFPQKVKVAAVDGGGKILTSYDKAVFFTSSDPDAKLPATSDSMHKFGRTDGGIHEFEGSGFILNKLGKQSLTVSDYSAEDTKEINVVVGTATTSTETLTTKFFATPKISSNPKVNTAIFTTAVALLLIPLLINLLIALINLIPQILYWLLWLLGARKKRKPWGVVFNSESGQPISLAMVRIYDSKTKKLLEQSMTDNEGRYGFLAREGIFEITAKKRDYTFPSNKKLITYYEEVYLGGKFTVNKKQIVILNIPMDPKKASGLLVAFKLRLLEFNHYLQYLRIPLLIIGGTVALILTIISYNLIYLLSLIFYLLLGLWEYIRWIRPKTYGIISNEKDAPIHLAVVRLYHQNGRLISTEVTDGQGRYRFIAIPGLYYLTASASGLKSYQSKIFNLEKKKGIVTNNIILKKS